MKTMKYFVWAAFALALGACTDENEFYGDSKQITIEAGFGGSSRVATNGLSSMFEADDAIGVYVWTGGTTLPDAATGYVANNVTNTFDDKNWTATPQMFWKDAKTPHYFLSVYPQTDILTTTTYTLDATDQEKSDLLVATNFGKDNGGIVAQSNPVPLAFGHVMAKLRVNIKFNDEFTTAPTVEHVTVGAHATATIDWQTATATATGNATGIELPALATAAQGYACSYESVMVPQSGFKSVVMVIGGETYTFTSNQAMQLKKGTITTLNLTVGLSSIQAEDISILDWTTGASIDGYLNNISEQITAINASLTNLKDVDVALQDLIDDLEGEAVNLKTQLDSNTAADAATKQALETKIAAIEALITTLQTKDAELDGKIAALQAYVNSEITATEDWATTTFATLEQYTAMQAEITAIQTLLKTCKADIAGEYTAAINTAIATLETSMKTWVNTDFAAGYYDIATIDGKLNVLSDALAEGNTDLQEQITAQQAALDQAKADLKTAYEKAIKDAIDTNNGIIDTQIAAAVKTAKDDLQSQINTITTALATLQTEILGVKTDIATIEQQITAIKASLGDLEAMDTELNGYIAALQTNATELKNKIDAANALIDNVKQEMGDAIDAVEQSLLTQLESLKTTLEGQLADVLEDIETLEAKDTELEAKIAALQTYLNEELAKYGTKDWANATFATLAQYEAVQTTLAGINTTLAVINTAMTDLENSIDAKIATDIQAAIAALPDYATQIATAVTDVTTAYTAAIATAKGEIETAYTAKIATAISTLEASMKTWVNEEIAKAYYNKAEIDAKLDVLAADAEKYTDAAELQEAIAEQQNALNNAVSSLRTAYTAAIVEAINNNNGTIDTQIAAITEAQTAFATQIGTINTAIEGINEKLTALENDVKALKARIQSIRFLPEYSDGKVKIGSASSPVELTFIVSPKEAAAVIAADKVKAFIYHTQSRAVDAQPLTVTRVSGDATTGMLTVTVTSPTDDYWATGKTANIYIQINDGNNDIISEMIPAYYYVEPDYVTFSATEVQTFSWATPEQPRSLSTRFSRTTTNGTFEFSVGGGEWQALAEKQTVTFGGTNGDLRLRGIAPEGTNGKIIAFGNETSVACSGDIRTLVDWENHTGANTENAVFEDLFNNCTQLTSAPALPATTLAEFCYYNMFNNCTQLTSAPALPATTLAVGCYFSMFSGCLRLSTAPVLPATELAVCCYESMFYGCTSLTAAPELKATTLVQGCYCNMFAGCSNLSSVTMLATEGFDEVYCLETWLFEVNSTGTFTRAEGMESIPTNSISGIPTGWTVKVKSVEQEQETLPGFNYVNGY